MKKIMFFILLLGLFKPLFAAKIAVTIGTGALQPGTTAGFNVSSGTIQNLSNVNQKSSGTYTVTGGTFAFTNAVTTGTMVNHSTATYYGKNDFRGAFTISTGPTQGSIFWIGSSSIPIGTPGLPAALYGTNTNDNAGVGTYGETISSVALAINFPTSGSYGDLASISLTPGNWMVSGTIQASTNSALVPFAVVGALSTSGDNPPSTGLCRCDFPVSPTPAGNDAVVQSFNSCQFKLAATTTVFLKYRANYSGGTPKATGAIIGLRIR